MTVLTVTDKVSFDDQLQQQLFVMQLQVTNIVKNPSIMHGHRHKVAFATDRLRHQ